MLEPKLRDEIQSFQSLWQGGFRCGYSDERNQKGVEDFIRINMCKPYTQCLEIGCGGGQWSKLLYPRVAKLYVVDVLSAEHNQFWQYIGEDVKDKIEYLHVKDFNLDGIPDNSIDFVFSYDVFCHISLSGLEQYLKSLKRVMKYGSIACIMYADIEKYINRGGGNMDILTKEYGVSLDNKEHFISTVIKECDGKPMPGRWYFVGITNFISLCQKYGFTVIHKDIDLDKLTPITLFANWKL